MKYWLVVLSMLLGLELIAAPGIAKENSVRIETRIETVTVPYEVRYEFNRNVGPGRLVKVQNGANGFVRNTFEIRVVNGEVVERRLVKADRKEPVAAVFHMGRAGHTTNRGSFNRSRVLNMQATAYDPSAGRGRAATFRTATGLPAQFGVVAVDPRIIPLGTKVFVEGYGFAIAADTGSAIRGMKIDLCLPTRAAAMAFGRRQVRVHILD